MISKNYQNVQKVFSFLIVLPLALVLNQCLGQERVSSEAYTYAKGDANGTGKWYMGREIAHVMGFQGMGWLDRPEREAEENTSKLLSNMNIQPDDRIADIGAGSGYHVFQMAPLASNGLIYAVDIQDEMLAELRTKKEQGSSKNVKIVKGSETNVNLAENSVDKVLMVDVYHEMSHPVETLASIKKALRANGKLFLIEYRGEDDSVPIKKLHKMTEAQAVKEMRSVGFKLEQNLDDLPWQHCMVFVKE